MSSLLAIDELIGELDIFCNYRRGKDALSVAVGVKVGVLDVIVNSNK